MPELEYADADNAPLPEQQLQPTADSKPSTSELREITGQCRHLIHTVDTYIFHNVAQ